MESRALDVYDVIYAVDNLLSKQPSMHPVAWLHKHNTLNTRLPTYQPESRVVELERFSCPEASKILISAMMERVILNASCQLRTPAAPHLGNLCGGLYVEVIASDCFFQVRRGRRAPLAILLCNLMPTNSHKAPKRLNRYHSLWFHSDPSAAECTGIHCVCCKHG